MVWMNLAVNPSSLSILLLSLILFTQCIFCHDLFLDVCTELYPFLLDIKLMDILFHNSGIMSVLMSFL